MDKPQALQFLAQLAQDFINSLPPSARVAVQKEAQIALNTLQEKPPEP